MPLKELPQDWHELKFQRMVPITTGSAVKSEHQTFPQCTSVHATYVSCILHFFPIPHKKNSSANTGHIFVIFNRHRISIYSFPQESNFLMISTLDLTLNAN